ncbi:MULTISPECIES: DUF937 domain-containing protein [Flavobacterium]|jgi:hypothetical protein|uniref:DUF937 domain-containing protein n=2 Tax=Flavobacterium TaxID=237 RepID=A0ABV8Z9H7_9FLAO|nr:MULTISPECIES: DUF937 domain-containing protein [Flavobacterium]MCM0665077.1 DUF937 domain-containing protein [Flavobacterium tyrosinilyticum]MDY0987979.1 DUF937 domain-containing protein [Flavobacterium sp. CFBP9031]PBI93673.1 hypothetical protein BSF41_07560 [Flavobacterium sp. ACN2]UPZ17116.1 DUF937 domain-containing protein [Flavobacterium humidisoli]
MTPNLQIELRRFISSNVVSKLNKFYFENDALLIKGIDVSIGTILMGLYNKAEESDFYSEIVSLIQEDSTFYQEIDFNAGRILSVDDCYRIEGNALLKELFSNKKGRISEMVSNEVGIKSETAREILNFSALLVMSYLRYNLQLIESLKLLLEDQKRDILNSIPPGIKIILGFSSYETVEDKNQSIGRSIFTLFGHNFFSF